VKRQRGSAFGRLCRLGSLLARLVGAISCYNRHPKFFPLWAMTRYRNLKRGDARAAACGM
jgi:hypothetical protein